MPFSVTTKFSPIFFVFNVITEKFKSLSKSKIPRKSLIYMANTPTTKKTFAFTMFSIF